MLTTYPSPEMITQITSKNSLKEHQIFWLHPYKYLLLTEHVHGFHWVISPISAIRSALLPGDDPPSGPLRFPVGNLLFHLEIPVWNFRDDPSAWWRAVPGGFRSLCCLHNLPASVSHDRLSTMSLPCASTRLPACGGHVLDGLQQSFDERSWWLKIWGVVSFREKLGRKQLLEKHGRNTRNACSKSFGYW